MAHTRDLLKLVGVNNGKEFAHLGAAPAVIFFLVKDRKNPNRLDHRAELHIFDEQGRQDETKVFRPEKLGPVSIDRVTCVQLAQTYADEIIGPGAWSRTPYSNSWIPSEHYEDAILAMEEKLEEQGIVIEESPRE